MIAKALAIVFLFSLFVHVSAEPVKGSAASAHLTTKQTIQADYPSVVRLTIVDKSGAPKFQGSGIVVDDDVIATNCHVIDGSHAVTANFANGRSETVYGILAYDSTQDLALVRAFTV